MVGRCVNDIGSLPASGAADATERAFILRSLGRSATMAIMPLSMRVRVRPYADLARFFPGAGAIREVDVPVGASIGDLLTSHGMDAEPRLTFGLNGNLAQRDAKLVADDLIDILVPMSGGA